MNPLIWKLIKDYMTRSRGMGAPSETRIDESFNKAQDAYDEWLGSGGEPEYSQAWRVLQRAMEEEEDKKRRKPKKLKKASKGHSRFGRGGGGYLPSDLSGSLKDDSIKSRILGHRRKPWS